MYLFFYGQNDFLIFRQVQKIKGRYKEKAGGDLNLTTVDGESMTLDQYIAQTQAVPLLFSSRLIIVNNIFKNKDKKLLEYVKENLEHISSSTVIVFTQIGEVDKRLGLYKSLLKAKNSKYFPLFEKGEIKKFITSEIKDRGGDTENGVVEMMSEYIGSDLWRLSTEIDKLIAYSKGRKITIDDVKVQIRQVAEGNIFSLIDSMAKGQKGDAILELESLLKMNEPALKILAMINYQFRIVSQVKEAQLQSSNNYAIAKITSLSPFQVEKVSTPARKYSWDDLAQVYSKILKIDVLVKTGKMSGDAALKDLVLGLKS